MNVVPSSSPLSTKSSPFNLFTGETFQLSISTTLSSITFPFWSHSSTIPLRNKSPFVSSGLSQVHTTHLYFLLLHTSWRWISVSVHRLCFHQFLIWRIYIHPSNDTQSICKGNNSIRLLSCSGINGSAICQSRFGWRCGWSPWLGVTRLDEESLTWLRMDFWDGRVLLFAQQGEFWNCKNRYFFDTVRGL